MWLFVLSAIVLRTRFDRLTFRIVDRLRCVCRLVMVCVVVRA